MKALSRVACAAALALCITAAAQADPLQPVRVTPDELMWKPIWTGAQLAILAGDPQKVGVYVAGMRFPAGFRKQPHFVWAKDGEVVIQVVGHGPSATTWSSR
jgi:hypothetical protein